ncbi:MAG: baeRF12 domain-containing protein [Paracoccaceae bacterium]
MKRPVVLYLIASDEEFRLIRGQGADLTEILHRRLSDLAGGDFAFSAPRGRNVAGGISFGVSSGQSEADIERPRLAAHAARALEAEWAGGAYDGIVVAAGPKLLGALRKALPKALQGHVAAEIHKTLVKLGLHDLPAHLAL